MTQNEKVLRHLRDRGSITSMEAFQMYGITRLSARISDIKETGVEIYTERQNAKNRDGKTVWFDRYFIREGVREYAR